MSSLISIIIPTYNRGELLLRAINSVVLQTYKNFELIVVDDGSTDNTKELLNHYITDKSIRYLYQDNQGVASARNNGVNISTGEYITFLDSDDEWLPTKLEEQINHFNNHGDSQICYTDEIWIRNNIRVNPKISHSKYSGRIFQQCIGQCFIAPSSVMIKRDFWLFIGGFDSKYPVCEDYDLWARISLRNEITLINKKLIKKYGGHNQLSTQYKAMDFWRIQSLANLIKSNKLSPDELLCTTDFIKQRSAILLLGYEKHQITDQKKIIIEILKEIQVE